MLQNHGVLYCLPQLFVSLACWISFVTTSKRCANTQRDLPRRVVMIIRIHHFWKYVRAICIGLIDTWSTIQRVHRISILLHEHNFCWAFLCWSESRSMAQPFLLCMAPSVTRWSQAMIIHLVVSNRKDPNKGWWFRFISNDALNIVLYSIWLIVYAKIILHH